MLDEYADHIFFKFKNGKFFYERFLALSDEMVRREFEENMNFGGRVNNFVINHIWFDY